MNKYLCGCVVIAAAVATGLVTGCEDDGSSSGSESPIGPAVGGSWNGSYSRPGYSEPLSAEIIQNGSSLVIETTKSSPGHFFTGQISADGYIQVMDEGTGKTWTSQGAITANHVYIRDYLDVSIDEAGGVQAITLDR